MHGPGYLAQGPFNFRMAQMPDQNNVITLGGVAAALFMDFRDERAGCIKDVQSTQFCAFFDFL